MGMSMAASTHGDKAYTSTVERLRLKVMGDIGDYLKGRQVLSSFTFMPEDKKYCTSIYLYCSLVYYFENSHKAEIN